jgi:hypothetical protein
MAATYWVNTAGNEYSVMDDTTMNIYSYNSIDDFNGNFYYYSYFLNDPYNQLGIFPGGNNYFNWLNTHREIFDIRRFTEAQNNVRSRFVNARETRVEGFRPFFGSADINYVRETPNSKTFVGKGFADDQRNVSQGATITPEPSIGRYYTIKFQAISGGQNPFAPDLQQIVEIQSNSPAFTRASKEFQAQEQAFVVDYFQKNPYGDGGGGGRAYLIGLVTGDNSKTACSGGGKTREYYIDNSELDFATVLTLDEGLREYASPGWYSDMKIVRLWDGAAFDEKAGGLCGFEFEFEVK